MVASTTVVTNDLAYLAESALPFSGSCILLLSHEADKALSLLTTVVLGSLAPHRFVGRAHYARVCRRGCDEPKSGECPPLGKEAAPPSQNQRVDHEHVLV